MVIPEPLSLLSLSAGLLGFLVGTIEKLALAVTAFVQAKHILQRYANSLSTHRKRLEAWENFWTPRAETAGDDATWLWGPDGTEAVQVHLRDIHRLLRATKKLIEGSSDDWSREESQRWAQCLAAITNPNDQAQPDFSPSLFQKAGLALYTNALLKENIANLKNSIEELKSRSWIEFNRVRRQDDEERQLSYSQLQDMRLARKRQANTDGVMRAVYNELRAGNLYYSLLMTLPQSPSTCRFDGPDVLDVSLLQSWSEFEKYRWYHNLSLRFSMDQDVEDSSRNVLEHIRLAGDEALRDQPNCQLSEDFKASLSRVIADDTPDSDRKFNNGTRVIRAKASLCVVIWTTIIWQADWLQDLCSCGLRMTRSTVTGHETPSFRRQPGHPFNAPCCLDNLQGRHHLLVGILLAELAILRPIFYERDRYSPRHFRVSEGDTIVQLSREELLRRVYTASTSSAYPNAISYCFQLDDQRGTTRIRNMPVADQLREYNEKVVKPLAAFYEEALSCHNLAQSVYEYAEQHSLLWQDPLQSQEFQQTQWIDFVYRIPGSFPED